MNEKINLQELINLLSQKSGITKKEAELFLKECFDTINEALLEEQSVKIKNLGSFKLSRVSDRESIDVVTGARVLIPAHYKVNFSADNSLAQTVNEPFSYFDPVEVNEIDEVIPSEEKIVFVEEEEEEEEEINLVTIDNPEITNDDFNIVFDNPLDETELSETSFVIPDKLETPEEKIETINKPEISFVIPDTLEIPEKEIKIKEEPVPEIKDASSFRIKPEVIVKIKGELDGKSDTKDTIDIPSQFTINSPNITIEKEPEIVIKDPKITIIDNPEITIKNLPDNRGKSREREIVNINDYPSYGDEKKNKRKKTKKYIRWLILPSYFVAIAFIALFFRRLYNNPDSFFNEKAPIVTQEENQTEKKMPSSSNQFPISDSIARIIEKYAPGELEKLQDSSKQVIENDTINPNKKETVTVKEKTVNPDKKDPPVSAAKTGSVKKVTIKNGETLTRLAYNEYGDKCFWVYIYEENKSIIKNPNDVPAGLTITIPPAEKYKIDKNNPGSINNANAIANTLK